MKIPSIKNLVAGMDDMATLPVTIIEMLRLLDDPGESAENLEKILERDVALTANILKLGNSAYYGSPHEIYSVRQAIVLLGNRSMATLAFAAGIAPIMRRDLDSYHIERDVFWEHSMVKAAASSLLANQLGIDHLCCEAFTVGLIQDVGMLLLDGWLVQQGESLQLGSNGYDDYRMGERKYFGFDHADVGASLARSWGFPSLYVDAIAHHHDLGGGAVGLSGETMALIRSIAAGSLVVDLFEHEFESAEPKGGENREQCNEITARLQNLGIDVNTLAELRLDLTEKLEETLTSATSGTVLT